MRTEATILMFMKTYKQKKLEVWQIPDTSDTTEITLFLFEESTLDLYRKCYYYKYNIVFMHV